MELYNINNDHLLTHRNGWHKIMYELSKSINSNIILVDFMDKYFNLWFDINKPITHENTIINFTNKDAYYSINDSDKSDIFVYYDKYNIYYIYKWYNNINNFKLLRGELIINLIKKYNIRKIKSSWIGILHYPEFVPEMNYQSLESLPNMLRSTNLKESIKKCKCIIALSEYLKHYIIKELVKYNYDIPIEILYHPTDFNCKLFDINNFISNTNKKIIQLGFWMRKQNTIYLIKTKVFSKYWLPGGKYWKEMFSIIYKNYEEYLNDTSVTIQMYLDNDAYDLLLSENICVVDVFNSSANNSVLECIARNTPLIVTHHPAIIEYLGEDYPLYFNTIEELNDIVNSNDFITKIISCTEYLKQLNKEKFTINNFCKDFENIINKYT